MDGVQLPEGYSHFEEAVYCLPLSPQKFLVLILSTPEGRKAESTMEPLSGFEHGTPCMKYMKLPYDLSCPSTKVNSANCLCPYILCKKIYYVNERNCSIKELLLYHLKAKQHYAYEDTDMISIEDDMHEDEEETLDIVDGPCLIPDIEKYLEQPFEVIYE